MQLSALFDIAPEKHMRLEWDADLPIEQREWNVGLIVGPSGCGKTSIASELFGPSMVAGFDWPRDHSVLDSFPEAMAVRDVVEALSSVGFNSPPAWLRPFHVLSNGEQFRVTCARALAENPALVVLDEFTSVVDRQVAKVAAHAIQKTIRRRGRQFIAVSCHFDIVDWLQPDWVYEPATGAFQWRELQRHPELRFEIRECGRELWPMFRSHHYLSTELQSAAKCFVATIDGQPVAFNSVLHLPHAYTRNIKMGHRLVVLPDWQGVGLGGRFDDFIGQWLHDRGFRYHNTVAHPAIIAYYLRSPRWRRLYADHTSGNGRPAIRAGKGANKGRAHAQLQTRRLNTLSFEYCPVAVLQEAIA
jgi:ABC-type thiamine transport system ATPase subunit